MQQKLGVGWGRDKGGRKTYGSTYRQLSLYSLPVEKSTVIETVEVSSVWLWLFFHRLSWICKIAIPEKKTVKLKRHVIFCFIHRNLYLYPKKLYNESFSDTFVIFLCNRIMLTRCLQIRTGTNLYWVTTIIFCRLSLFFIFSILAVLLYLHFMMLTFTILAC